MEKKLRLLILLLLSIKNVKAKANDKAKANEKAKADDKAIANYKANNLIKKHRTF